MQLKRRHIERRGSDSDDPDAELAAAVRDAIQDCCSPEAFENAADAMRASVGAPIDMAINIASMFSRLPEEFRAEFFSLILDQFAKSSSHTRFDWMNAVTAVARTTINPEARWRLEEAGGAIPFDFETPLKTRRRVLTA